MEVNTSDPFWAVGFWQDLKLGAALGGINRVCNTNCENVSTSGVLFGGSANAGISLHPLVPIAVGLGLDYHMGNLTFNSTYTYKTSRLYIKMPLAYQISFLNIQSRIGLYPSYSIYTVYDNDNISFKGLSLGIFWDMYFKMGFLGLGGGLFTDYGPKLGRKEGELETNISVLHYGINLGINLSFGILE